MGWGWDRDGINLGGDRHGITMGGDGHGITMGGGIDMACSLRVR